MNSTNDSKKATPDNAIPEPSPGPLKNEPTPERAAEEKQRQQADAEIEPQNRKH